MPTLRILIESVPKKAFASALDWPGLSRGGRDENAALEALSAALPRYAPVAEAAGQPFPLDGIVLDVVERSPGDASTQFGVPAVVAPTDREPTSAAEAHRQASLVAAAWEAFDRIAAAAPEELRKGPRGGGRDRSKIVEHVNGADTGYAAAIGRKHQFNDRAAIEAMRADVLAVLREPSDGSPIAGKKWPPRYAARRIAWHALEHAWEIEDRTERD
ncbi:MAG TPA: hypothetical protein VIR16_05860 [Candidatus Limnocylindrales bacterium]